MCKNVRKRPKIFRLRLRQAPLAASNGKVKLSSYRGKKEQTYVRKNPRTLPRTRRERGRPKGRRELEGEFSFPPRDRCQLYEVDANFLSLLTGSRLVEERH